MTATVQTNNAAKWGMYAIMGFLTLVFLMSGGTKLMADAMQVENFTHWGYRPWFMYMTGFIEVGGVILLWIPQTRLYGAIALMATMLGATATHLINSEFFMAPMPVLFLGLAGIVAWVNRP